MPVRTDAPEVAVHAPGDPVGSAGLAPVDGPPVDLAPLEADPTLPVPDGGDACWRGYCDVHHLVLRILAPHHDGATTVPVVAGADGSRIRLPLHLETTRNPPEASLTPDAVRIEAPEPRALDAVHLRGPNGSWAARGTGDAFLVPHHDLPRGTPLVPTLTLRNGTTVEGEPVRLPPEPGDEAGPRGEGPLPPGGETGPTDPPPGGNATDGDEPQADGTGDAPRQGGPVAPPRADGASETPVPAAAGIAALAAAARATL